MLTRSLDDLLDEFDWARQLGAPDRARLRTEVIVRDVAADTLICVKGEPVTHWVGVVEGLVKIAAVSRDGKPVTFTGVPAGGWLGEGSMLKDEPRRYDVVALRHSRVALMPRATFQRLLDTSLVFNRFLITQLNERLAHFIATVEYERMLSPDARVARCLAQMFNPILFPARPAMLIEVSQTELGYLTGLSRQRANQALQSLEACGLLRIDYGGITVLDLPGLSRFGE